jgi:phage protein D
VSIGRPTATLTVDGRARSMPEAAVAALRVDLALGACHDRATLSLWSRSDFADVEPGATVAIALGFGDQRTDVFTGAAEVVDAVPGGVVIEALSTTAELSRVRVAQAYLQQSVGDIVRDLVGKGGGTVGEVDAPRQLPAYHVDERRPVWQHLVDLARLASCELCGDARGAVCCRAPRRGAADRRLRHGAELLGWRLGDHRALPDPIPVVPYGAASENGSAAWHLVLRTPDGESPSGPSVVQAAVRDRDLAQALDTGRRAARDRAAGGGEVIITGDAGLRPGALVTVADLPDRDPRDLRVLAVSHVMDGAQGFVTTLRTEAAA